MLERLSNVEQSQGVVSLVKAAETPDLAKLNRILVCDHLADPGNLGALMRSARGAGLDGLVALGGVDLFHPKVVRASAGAIFHLPCYRLESMASLASFCKIALAPRDGVDLYRLEWPERWALVVGNEAHGIGAEVRSSLDLLCTIPMAGHCESLNAAVSASVVLFEWRRRALSTC
jgi:TrmH family RNA methyltransferase